jgi:uncharacterized protein YggU (UPF0235/DUF167 family)
MMIGREFNFHNGKKGSALAIRITKRSGDQRISNVMKDGTVVINLAREIEDPNQELLRFLSKELGIAQQRIDIIAGLERNEKLLSILDMEPEKIQELVLGRLS